MWNSLILYKRKYFNPLIFLIELNETIKISPYISEFNEELFNATIDKIIVGSDRLVTFCLVGGLKIKEEV